MFQFHRTTGCQSHGDDAFEQCLPTADAITILSVRAALGDKIIVQVKGDFSKWLKTFSSVTNVILWGRDDHGWLFYRLEKDNWYEHKVEDPREKAVITQIHKVNDIQPPKELIEKLAHALKHEKFDKEEFTLSRRNDLVNRCRYGRERYDAI